MTAATVEDPVRFASCLERASHCLTSPSPPLPVKREERILGVFTQHGKGQSQLICIDA
jgi:hypothetical protein